MQMVSEAARRMIPSVRMGIAASLNQLENFFLRKIIVAKRAALRMMKMMNAVSERANLMSPGTSVLFPANLSAMPREDSMKLNKDTSVSTHLTMQSISVTRRMIPKKIDEIMENVFFMSVPEES